MVRRVDNTFDECDHRETNHQLARELSEVRQQMSNLINELHRRDAELYELKRENIDLKRQVHDSNSVKRKYNLIVNIVYDQDESSRQPLCLPGPSNGELESLDNSDDKTPRILDRISERSEENSYSDSLDPPEVTAVTPLKSRVEIPQTPSVFNCLDTLRKNDESNEHNGLRDSTNYNSPIQNNKSPDMFQSTPVQRQTRSNQPAMVVEISQIRTEDQENFKIVQLDNNTSDTVKTVKGKKRQTAKRATPQNPEPSRYNLRKRCKKIED